MIAIDKVLISDEIADEQFACNLTACKGACCVDGDAGAPLEEEELIILKEIYEQVKIYLDKKNIAIIEKQGLYVYHQESKSYVTPAIDGKMCAYGIVENGIVKCGIEKAYLDKKINFRKPISCHLYPIRVEKHETYDALNYEPREALCGPACILGKRLKVPVYRFLKDAIIRKYGEAFYKVLDKIATGNYEVED